MSSSTHARFRSRRKETRGADFDFTTEGWVADYADPFDFINVLLSGDSLHASNNNNIAYFNDPKYNKAMLAASRLVGNARYNSVRRARRRHHEERGSVGIPCDDQRPRSSCRLAPVASRSTRSSPFDLRGDLHQVTLH